MRLISISRRQTRKDAGHGPHPGCGHRQAECRQVLSDQPRSLGEDRVIVANIAGTRATALTAYVENGTGIYLLIDTAGIRKKSRVDEKIEKFSVMRSLLSGRARRCMRHHDRRDGRCYQTNTRWPARRTTPVQACIIVVNKWDLVEKRRLHHDGVHPAQVRNALSYMLSAPVLFISAQTGQRVDNLF